MKEASHQEPAAGPPMGPGGTDHGRDCCYAPAAPTTSHPSLPILSSLLPPPSSPAEQHPHKQSPPGGAAPREAP